MKQIQKAVIKKDNKFLILRRSANAKHFPQHWDFPGGRLEPNEEPVTGIVREVLEETNLNVKVLEVVGIYELDLEKNGAKTHRFTIYATKLLTDHIKISEEHSAFKWATKEEILKLKTEPCISLYFQGAG